MKKKKIVWIVFAVVAIISFIIYAFYYEIRDRILNLGVDIQAITKAAEQGDAEAQARLGYYYGSGKVVKQDKAKGIEWTRKAAEQGIATSQVSLGLCYLQGDGVPVDKEEAIKWLRKAAEQGNPLAKEWLEKLKEE